MVSGLRTRTKVVPYPTFPVLFLRNNRYTKRDMALALRGIICQGQDPNKRKRPSPSSIDTNPPNETEH